MAAEKTGSEFLLAGYFLRDKTTVTATVVGKPVKWTLYNRIQKPGSKNGKEKFNLYLACLVGF
jgi:hypothetical protein